MPSKELVFPAAYKGKEGSLTLRDAKSLEWNAQNQVASLIIPLMTVKSKKKSSFNMLMEDLKASVATNAKVMIRVFAAAEAGQEPVAHTFAFTSKSARKECDSMKTSLQEGIAEVKRNAPDSRRTINEILTKHSLEADLDMQQSLLDTDAELKKMFHEAVVKGGLTPAQFWSTRTHLLRSFAVSRAQMRGPYNVLSTIKPKSVDNKVKVSLSREKIRDIFDQHELVKQVYDDNVPPLSDEDFWSRFFLSKLCKKLRGERLTPLDTTDNIMDKYLNVDEQELRRKRQRVAETVPRFIDVEGNEENNSQRRGNRPDETMRPSENERVPILRSLNNISQHMVRQVAPMDRDEGASLQREIRIADLSDEKERDKAYLHVDNQQQFNEEDEAEGVDGGESVDYELALKDLHAYSSHSVDLQQMVQEAGPSDASYRKIMARIIKHANELASSDRDLLPTAIRDDVFMCHAATIEFLRHFWSALLSGEAVRQNELKNMIISLSKTEKRIEAVAKRAGSREGLVVHAFDPTMRAVRKALATFET